MFVVMVCMVVMFMLMMMLVPMFMMMTMIAIFFVNMFMVMSVGYTVSMHPGVIMLMIVVMFKLMATIVIICVMMFMIMIAIVCMFMIMFVFLFFWQDYVKILRLNPAFVHTFMNQFIVSQMKLAKLFLQKRKRHACVQQCAK